MSILRRLHSYSTPLSSCRPKDESMPSKITPISGCRSGEGAASSASSSSDTAWAFPAVTKVPLPGRRNTRPRLASISSAFLLVMRLTP